MDLQLKGKKAIVTGGSAGIGLAIAQLLAEEGAEVTVPGRSEKKVREALAGMPGILRALEADLTTAPGAETLIAAVPETDILVNNLGIYETKAFGDVTDADWLRYFEVNVLGGVRLARHYFPRMLKRNAGRIIFVSSETAVDTHADMIHYGVTKTSQLAVARGLAELTKGTNITVNTVLPGPTRAAGVDEMLRKGASNPNLTTEEIEREFFAKRFPHSLLQRMAEGREVASLVAYLASPLASATNGAAVRVEGGVLKSVV